tara:strand:- start:40 stop:372 length:333 start_codon:yes stop_codon:yes gene_type:complete
MNRKSDGFTLIELIVVIAIAVPRLTGVKSMAEKRVCDANRKIVERLYNTLFLENEHQESEFNQFLIENFDEICPAGGVIGYEDGKVKCSMHEDPNKSDEDDPPGDEVPWL